VSDIAPNDVASDTPQTLTDEAILARFHASRNPPGSARTLGFRMLSVSQAERRVEIAFEPSVEAVGNPMGQVQGGFVCAMLDECMSVAGMIASGMTAWSRPWR
jgi:acyl-coenzyme A thioesterase PaaI-like protein